MDLSDDYKLCDKCGKTLYWNYDINWGMGCDYGDEKALCGECAEKYEIKIVKKEEPCLKNHNAKK